jgi:glycosyltransferase involved in cell wall biosynthesis
LIKVISVGYKAEGYITKCIKSVLNQTYKNWEMIIVLDPCDDKTYDEALQYRSEKIKVFKNTIRRYAIGNISMAVKMLNCQGDDILVWLDCDDKLANNKVFEIVMSYYNKNKNLLVTHGSWQPYPDKSANTNNGAYTRNEFKYGLRCLKLGYWRGSHLRTMKYKVYKHINQDREFKWPDGRWLESSYDMSLMYPALEMAGFDRVQFIPEILYIYNRETAYNDDKVNSNLQGKCANYLSRLPRYNVIENF